MPTLVFDGDCGFCTTASRFAEQRVHTRATVMAYQHVELGELGLTAEACAAALQYVDDIGRAWSGADAVSHYLWDAGGGWAVLGGVMRVPGIRQVSRIAYRAIARNRHRLPGSTPACAQHNHQHRE